MKIPIFTVSKCGQSLLVTTIAALTVGGAYAQDTIEEIVVTGTGTSIRGEAPVGQNLISIGREAIQESGAVSVQQILNDVPQITGFGNAAQGSYGSADGSENYAPTIHSLGASASNSTLVVVNGHRLPLTGIAHNLADPSIIPPAAIERVEILPDGASATYGSDAVAGVLNFITRTDVEGVELSAQTGFAEGAYRTANFNILTGTSYDAGSITAAYSYSYRSGLANADRPNIRSDLRDAGGRNFADDNCGPAATIDVGGGVKYAAPYTLGDQFSENYCTDRAFEDLIPSERRHSVLLAWEHDVSDRLHGSAEVVYHERRNNEERGRGTANVRVDAADGNPFFVAAPDGDTSYTARWDASPYFGSGAKGDAGQRTFMLSGSMEYNFANDWYLTAGGTLGRDHSFRARTNQLCSSCVEEAATVGAQAGWLNLWGAPGEAAAGGYTPPGGIRALHDWITNDDEQADTVQDIVDLNVKVDGTLMSLPAGDLKVAFGANKIHYGADYDLYRGISGPSSTSASTIHTEMNRDVNAIYGEALIPITERISLSAAVRTDDYSDFGSTTNPRIAAQWHITDSIKVRASWAEAFVAPAFSSRGERGTGLTTQSGYSENGTDGFVPVGFSDPNTAQFLAWVEAEYPGNCEYDGATLLGCNVGSGGLNAARVTGGNDDAVAATGETWSVGIDFTAPEWAPGLRANITYYDALLNNMITAPRLNNILEVPGLNSRIMLLPTQAEWNDWIEGLPQSGDLPVHSNLPVTPEGQAVFGYAWSFQQINAFNIDSAGIDLDMEYTWDTDLGSITLGWNANRKLRFDQQAGTGGEWVDYLNTDANTTFSSIEYLANYSLAWRSDNASAKVTWKHQSEYDGTSVARTETVDAFNTINFYGSYNLVSEALWGDTQLFLQVNNLLDEEPPFLDTNGGYNSSDASPLGRVTTLGFRKTF